jgi:hypothetical protein
MKTITLNSSLSASYQPCNKALGMKELCWTTRITWLYPPVETSVYCDGSATYFLNQQWNSCKQSVPVEITTLTKATPSHPNTITVPALSSKTFDQCFQSLAEMFTPPGPQMVLRPPIQLLSDVAHISAYCTKPRTHSCELVAARAHLYYVLNSELYQPGFRELCKSMPLGSISFSTKLAQGVTSVVVISGTTLPADKVYVSVENLAAWKFSSGSKGTLEPWFVTISPQGFTGMLFTLESEGLSSIRHPFTYSNIWPFNYAV